MDKIIERIMAIEKTAQSIVSEARAAGERLDETIAADIEEKKREIDRRRESKTAEIDAYEKEQADIRIESIKKSMEEKTAELEKKYAENRDRWIDEVFRCIVGE